jgi:hypothetical protein
MTHSAATLNAADLVSAPREQLDKLFRDSPPGPIPTGRGRGTAILFPGSVLDRPFAALVRLLFWKGKVFHPETKDLRNLLTPFGIQGIRASVYEEKSWFSSGPAVILDYSKTSFVAKMIRDEIRLVSPGVYLGQVFWGKKRIALFMLEFPVTR